MHRLAPFSEPTHAHLPGSDHHLAELEADRAAYTSEGFPIPGYAAAALAAFAESADPDREQDS